MVHARAPGRDWIFWPQLLTVRRRPLPGESACGTCGPSLWGSTLFTFTFMMSAMAASEDSRRGLGEPRRLSAARWILLPGLLPGAGGSAPGRCVLGGSSWPVPFHTGCRRSCPFPEAQLPRSLLESRLDPNEAADPERHPWLGPPALWLEDVAGPAHSLLLTPPDLSWVPAVSGLRHGTTLGSGLRPLRGISTQS